MFIETERKFLVRGDFRRSALKGLHIVQGYLCTDPKRTVRVRIKGDSGFVTVKGQPDEEGVSRFEWEREIPADEAQALLRLALPGAIDKTRWIVPYGNHTWEVDEFHGENEGLVVAEIELARPDEGFARPEWLGEEVTGDPRYYNSSLTKHPYCKWTE